MVVQPQLWGRLGKLLLCLCALHLAHIGAVIVRLGPKDAQGFMDAIAAFGSSGEDTTILLPGGVFSLAGGSIVSAQPRPGYTPFSAGTLTIAPADESTPTILDTRMLYGVGSVNGTPTPFSGSAKLLLNDMALVNLCDLRISLDAINGVYGNTAYFLAWLLHTRSYLSHIYTNVTLYSRPADVAAFQYILLVLRCKSKRFSDLTRPIVAEISSPLFQNMLLTAHAFVSNLSLPATKASQLTMKDTTDPFDPLLAPLRAVGGLMEPRFCVGPGSPPLLVDPSTPAWLTTDTDTWVQALAEASKQQAQPTTTYRPPGAIVLAGFALPAVLPSPPRVVPLTGGLLLTAPYNDLPGAVVEGILDMTGSTQPLMRVADTGVLFIQGMKLKGLAARPLPQAGSSPGPASVFPLSAFPLSPASAAIELNDVTLVLPTDDYTALLTLALQGTPASISSCVSAATRAHAAALQAGISSLVVARAEAHYQEVVLAAFVGWGLNASGLVLQPEDPVVSHRLRTACQSGTAGQSQSTSSCKETTSLKIALIVVCSAAGVLLCSTVLLGLLLVRQHRRHPAALSTVLVTSMKPAPDPSPQHDSKPVIRFTGLDTDVFEGSPMSEQMAGRTSTRASLDNGAHKPWGQPSLLQVVSAADTGTHRAAPPVDDIESGFLAATDETARRNVRVVLTRGLTQETLGGSGAGTGPSQPEVAAQVNLQQQQEQEPRKGEQASSGPVSGDSSTRRPDPRADIAQLMDKMTAQTEGPNELVEVEGLLGTGSWGTVYQGRWRGLHVALKTLVFEADDDQAGAAGQGAPAEVKVQHHAQAIMEAAVAASVDHANVVRTYYYDIKPLDVKKEEQERQGSLQISMQHEGVKQFKLFLVQELCSTSLSAILDKHVLHCSQTGRVIEPLTVVWLLLDIATGLAYLHSRNIVHGDLKPANVLLKSSPTSRGGVIAKLADFGLSAHLGGGATHVSQYRGGTPFYVAPEVVLEHRTSTAADVYSFGVIAWQLYTGIKQYQRSPDGVYSWNPLFPYFHEPNVPALAFQTMVNNCLRRDPRLRPTSTHLIRELELMHHASTRMTGHNGASSPARPREP